MTKTLLDDGDFMATPSKPTLDDAWEAPALTNHGAEKGHSTARTDLIDVKMLERAKAAVLNSGELKTVQDVAKMMVCGVADARRQLDKWLGTGQVFAIRHDGVEYFPRYVFDKDEGCQPFPAVARVLQIFPESKGAWELAFWFESVNGHLGGKSPKEVLASDPAKVVEAARDDAESVANG